MERNGTEWNGTEQHADDLVDLGDDGVGHQPPPGLVLSSPAPSSPAPSAPPAGSANARDPVTLRSSLFVMERRAPRMRWHAISHLAGRQRERVERLFQLRDRRAADDYLPRWHTVPFH